MNPSLDRGVVHQKIAGSLAARFGIRLSISDDTEIYYDLSLYGDDLWEFFVWLNSEFGLEVRANIFEYAPGECPLFPIRLRRWIEKRRGQRRYRSLRVGAIVDAVMAGVWPPQ